MVGREEAWPERRDVDAHECRTRQEREEKWKKKKKGEEEKEEEKEVLSFLRLGIGVHDTSLPLLVPEFNMFLVQIDISGTPMGVVQLPLKLPTTLARY